MGNELEQIKFNINIIKKHVMDIETVNDSPIVSEKIQLMHNALNTIEEDINAMLKNQGQRIATGLRNTTYESKRTDIEKYKLTEDDLFEFATLEELELIFEDLIIENRLSNLYQILNYIGNPKYLDREIVLKRLARILQQKGGDMPTYFANIDAFSAAFPKVDYPTIQKIAQNIQSMFPDGIRLVDLQKKSE